MSNSSNLGADAVDVAIASGLDFDGTPIPEAKLNLYLKFGDVPILYSNNRNY